MTPPSQLADEPVLVPLSVASESVRVSNLADFSLEALRCESLVNPLGLDIQRPRLSWRLTASREGILQSAFQIEVSTDAGRVWNSSRVESEQSIQVEYGGPDLQPHTRYRWRVRVWDERGRMSPWSEEAYWETGFLGAVSWPAEWIGFPVGEAGAGEKPCRYLRRAFHLDKLPQQARLYVTARGLFEAWLNGERVGSDWLTPGWTEYGKRLEYLTYDVTEQLHLGENVLGSILADGWFSGYLSLRVSRNNYGEEPGVLAVLRMVDAEGNVEIVGSDLRWSGLTGPLLSADLYMGERFDARLEKPDWCQSGFEGCLSPVVSRKENPDDVLLEGKRLPPSRIVQEVVPIARTEISPDRLIFDFGQNLVGVLRLKLRAPSGTALILRHAEMLQDDGTLYTENLRAAKSTDYYTCRGGGEECYQPRFTFHGFRYAEIAGLSGEVQLMDVTALVLQSDLQPSGSFSCSHSLINQLQSNIQWGQRGNFIEIPMDCPQRDERLGWTGDAQIFCRTATFNYDVEAFFHKWMTDVRDAQYEDGSFPDVAPDLLRVSNAKLRRIAPHPHSGNAAYAEAGIICPWVIYERYGCKHILEDNYDAMCRWMDYQVRTARDYVSPPTSYGDWLATDAVKPAWSPTPCELVGTAYFAHCAALMARIAAILERPEDEIRFAEIRTRVVAAFQREFVTASWRLVGDTQTGYLLALAFDLLPEGEARSAAADYLVKALARRNNHLSTGFVGTPLLCPVLSRIGRVDLAYQLLLNEDYPSWLFPVRNGATTIWERWNSWTPEGGFGEVSMNSFNHYAYGAIGEWLYGNVAGIRPAAPGFQQILFQPEPGLGLTSAQAKLDSPYGVIESAWRVDGFLWQWSITVPPNTRASVVLPPGCEMKGATINGHLLEGQTHPDERGSYGLSLLSGSYQLESPYISPFSQ